MSNIPWNQVAKQVFLEAILYNDVDVGTPDPEKVDSVITHLLGLAVIPDCPRRYSDAVLGLQPKGRWTSPAAEVLALIPQLCQFENRTIYWLRVAAAAINHWDSESEWQGEQESSEDITMMTTAMRGLAVVHGCPTEYKLLANDLVLSGKWTETHNRAYTWIQNALSAI